MSYPPPPENRGTDPYGQQPAAQPPEPQPSSPFAPPQQPAPQPPYGAPGQSQHLPVYGAPEQQPSYGSPDQPQPPYGAPEQPWQAGPVPGYVAQVPPPPKKKHTGLKVAAGVVGGVLTLGLIGNALSAGDGGQSVADPTTQTQTPSPTQNSTTPSPEATVEQVAVEVIPDATYYTFADLQAAYNAAGGDCETTLELPQRGVTSLSQAECPDGSVLALFATQDDMLTQSSALMELAVQSDTLDGLLIVSDTWTINPGDSVDPDQITSVMGGVVVTEADYAATEDDESGGVDASGSDEDAGAADLTVSQQNAIGTARDYLDYSGFSRSGLIEQLEYEGYSNEDATFAVDYLDVDWNEQAVAVAESYIDYSGFSRSGLIDQLEYEGFSAAEAEYGVSNITVDWNEQAARVAQSYLDYSDFSRQGLLDQLLYEGFTQEQAEYGLEAVGY